MIRPLGRFSSALSTWLRYFQETKLSLVGRVVLSIGVGHGAVATAALKLGAIRVLGIDLLESFPMITQREGTYKPHEVISSGYTDSFAWHKHVYDNGGDVFTFDWDSLSGDELVIVDIEVPLLLLSKIFATLPSGMKMIVRFSCCNNCLNWVLGNLKVTKLFCQTAIVSSTMTYIGVIEKEFATLEGSVNNVRNVEIRPVRSVFTRSLVHATERINDLLLPYALSCKEATLPELRKLAHELRNVSLHSSNPLVAQHAQELSEDLRLMVDFTKDPTSMTTQRIDELDRTTLERVGSYLSCSLHGIDDILDEWTIASI
jgi:hypothetical protein